MAGSSLWTPQGETLLEKDVEVLTAREVQILSAMHDLGVKFRFSVVCKKCDHSFVGNNNDSQSTLSIACRCRELRFTR